MSCDFIKKMTARKRCRVALIVCLIIAVVIIVVLAVVFAVELPGKSKTKDDSKCTVYRMVTSVVQVFEQDGMDGTSNFNLTCALTSSCDTATMALFVAGNRYLTEENATVCISISLTDGGYNKSCVFEIGASVIRNQHSMDISCALLQDGGVAKQEQFLLQRCSDRSSDCNCSTKTTSCDEICSKVVTCLKHDPASRYKNITTEQSLICPILCFPKWCRDTYHFDKTVTVTPEIIQAMCANS